MAMEQQVVAAEQVAAVEQQAVVPDQNIKWYKPIQKALAVSLLYSLKLH